MSWGYGVKTVAGALALCVFVPMAAQAEGRDDGWYVSGHVGAAMSGESEYETTVENENEQGDMWTSSGTGEVGTKTGFGLGAAVGYGWENVRVEGELSWLRGDVDSFSIGGGDGSDDDVAIEWGGDVSVFGVMANGYYDIDTDTKWVPYVGGGLGAARSNLKLSLTVEDLETGTVESGNIEDVEWLLAYQVGAGVGYRVSDAIVLQLGYRFFGTSDITDAKTKLQFHKVEIGVRYGF